MKLLNFIKTKKLPIFIVLVVILILNYFAIPSFTPDFDAKSKNICLVNIKSIHVAVDLFLMDKIKGYKESITINELINGGYLKKEYKCPNDGKYIVESTKKIDEYGYSIYRVSCLLCKHDNKSEKYFPKSTL